MPIEEPLRSQLIAALSAGDKELVNHPQSIVRMDEFPVPFLQTYRIYWITAFNPQVRSRPLGLYLGFAPGRRAYHLNYDRSSYAALAQADGIHIDSPDLAAQYAAVYLTVTRSMSELFYGVQSVDDLLYVEDPSEAQAAAQAAFQAKYRSVIQPPAARQVGGGYHVTLYAARQRALERHLIVVQPDGVLTTREVQVLERDLPLQVGM
jgi:hypothetical protein